MGSGDSLEWRWGCFPIMHDEIDREPEPVLELLFQARAIKQCHGRSGFDEQIDVTPARPIVETRSE
jgi:hypothetical protein